MTEGRLQRRCVKVVGERRAEEVVLAKGGREGKCGNAKGRENGVSSDVGAG